MKALREKVGELMVAIHQITPELAAYHVADMTDADIERRLEMYKRMGIRGGRKREKDYASARPSEL